MWAHGRGIPSSHCRAIVSMQGGQCGFETLSFMDLRNARSVVMVSVFVMVSCDWCQSLFFGQVIFHLFCQKSPPNTMLLMLLVPRSFVAMRSRIHMHPPRQPGSHDKQ